MKLHMSAMLGMGNSLLDQASMTILTYLYYVMTTLDCKGFIINFCINEQKNQLSHTQTCENNIMNKNNAHT